MSLVLLIYFAVCSQSTVVLFDKEFFSQSFSDADFSTWSITGANPLTQNLATSCNGDRLFGGYGLFTGDPGNSPTSVSRTFSSLPPHYSLRIKAKLYKIDSWNNERLSLQLDGLSVDSYNWASTFGSGDLCGTVSPVIDPTNSAYYDGYVLVDSNVSHSASTLTVSFSTDLGTNGSAYWGFREFSIELDDCDPSCLSCGAATGCLSCPSGGNMLAGVPAGGGLVTCSCDPAYKTQLDAYCLTPTCIFCVTTCPNQYYPNAALCSPCAAGCETCSGPSAASTDCLSCRTIGFFSNASNAANPCPSCDSSCYACTGNLPTDCTSCRNGLLLSAGTCISTCPAGQFGVQTTGTCTACATNCATCFGSLSTQCSSCSTNYFLSSYQCVSTCPSSYYSYSSVCYLDCPSGSYGDTSTWICTSCPSNCLACTASQCTNCTTGYGAVGNTCVNPCPTGQYISATTTKCSPCDSSCASCSGPGNADCMSCATGTTLLGGRCSSGCSAGTFLNGSTANCDPCYLTCLTCINGLQNGCMTCNAGLYYDINNTQCLSLCDASIQAIDQEEMNCWTCPAPYQPMGSICNQCFGACTSCYGGNMDECLSCAAGRSLTYGMCMCDQGTYENASGGCDESNQTPSVKAIIWGCLLANLCLCLLLELFFKNQTNFIITIELFQIISFGYYLTASYPFDLNGTYLQLLKSHVGILIPPIYLPDLFIPKSTGKLSQTQYTGYLILDGQGVLVGYFTLLLLYTIPKLLHLTVSPTTSRSLFNACGWFINKIEVLNLLWFRFTVMTLFASAGLTFVDFSWQDELDLTSLGYFVLLAIMMICLLCVKKWDADSKTYQFALVWSNEVDYKVEDKEKENQKRIKETRTTEANETKQNLNMSTDNNLELVNSMMVSPLNKTTNRTNRKIFFPIKEQKNKEQKNEEKSSEVDNMSQDLVYQPGPTNEDVIDVNYLAMQKGLLFLPLVKIAIALGVPLLKRHPLVQGIFYSAACGMLASAAFSMKWKRKITKLTWNVCMIFLTINSILVTTIAGTSSAIPAYILIYSWAVIAIFLAVLTVLQLTVNLALLPKIFCSIPLRIHKVLKAEPDLK